MAKPVLWCAWFCPFAQRAWIALEHKGVQYDYREQDPYDKTEEFLAVNPRGLVPALSLPDVQGSVYESTVLLDFIEDNWVGTGPSLAPSSTYGRAMARIWMDFINKKIVPPFYQCLQFKEPERRMEAGTRLVDALRAWTKAAEEMSADGPFFFGSQLSIVDIALAPWAWRMTNVLPHYRGVVVPDTLDMKRYHAWLAAVFALPAFKATLCSEERLMQKYQRYADNTADTEVAHAINKGQALP